MKEYNNSEKSEESEESEEENITTTKKTKKKVQVNEITEMPSCIMDGRVKYNEETINLPKADDIIKSKNESIEETDTDIKEEQENKLTDEEIKKRNEEIEKIKQGAEKKMLNKKDKTYLSYLDQPYENADTLKGVVSIFNTYMLVNMPNAQTMKPNRRNYFLKNRILKTLSEKEIRAQKFYQDMVQIAKHQTNKQKFTTFSFYSAGSGCKLLVADKITAEKMEIAFSVHNKPSGKLSHTFGHCYEGATFPPEDIIPRNAQEYGVTISKIFKMLKEDVPEIKIALTLKGQSLGTHLMMNLCNTTFKDIDFQQIHIIWQQIPTSKVVGVDYTVRPEKKAVEMFTFLKSSSILQLFKEKNENVSIRFIVSYGKTMTQETFHTPKGSFVFFNKLEKLIEDDKTLNPDDRNLLKQLMHDSKMLFNSNFPETFMRFLKDVLDKNQLDIEPCDMLARYNIFITFVPGSSITKQYKKTFIELLKHANVKKILIEGNPAYTVEDFIKDFTQNISSKQDDELLKELGLQNWSRIDRRHHELLFEHYYTLTYDGTNQKKIDFKKFIYAMWLKKKLKNQHQTFYQKTMKDPYIYREFMEKILVQQQDVDDVIDKLNKLEDIAKSYNIWINPADALKDKFNILRDIHLNYFEKMKSAIFEKNDTDNEKLRKEKLLKQIIIKNFYSYTQDFALTPNYVENFITYAKYCIKYNSLALFTPAKGKSDFPLHKDFNYDFKPEDAQKIDNIIRIKQEMYKKIKQFIVNETSNDQEAKKANSFFVEYEYDIQNIFVFPSLQSCLNDPVQQTVVRKFEKLIPYMDVFLLKLVNEVGTIETFFKEDHDDFASFFTNIIINRAEQNFPEINSKEDADKFADFCAKSFTIYKMYKKFFCIEHDISYNALETEKEKTKFENLPTMAKNFTIISQGIQEAIKPKTLTTCRMFLKKVIEDRVRLGDVPDSFSNDMAMEYGRYIGKLALLREFEITHLRLDIYNNRAHTYNFKEIISDGEKKKQFAQMFSIIEIYQNSKEYIAKHIVQKDLPKQRSIDVLINNAMLGTLPETYHEECNKIRDYILNICNIDARLSLLKEFSYTEFQKPENQDMLKCIVKIKPFFKEMITKVLGDKYNTNEKQSQKIGKLCKNLYDNFKYIDFTNKGQTAECCKKIAEYTQLQLSVEQMYSDDKTLKEAILADLPSYKEFKDNKAMQLHLVSILENKTLVIQHYLGDRKNKKHWLEFMSNIFYLYNSNQYNRTLKHIDGLYNFLFNTSGLIRCFRRTLQDQQCKCKDFLLLCLIECHNYNQSSKEDYFSQRYSLEKIFNAFDLIFQAKNTKDAQHLEVFKKYIKPFLSCKPTTMQETDDRLCNIFGLILGQADLLSRCRVEEAKDLLYIVDNATLIKQGAISIQKDENLKSSLNDNQNEDKEEDTKIETVQNSITNKQICKTVKNSTISLDSKKEVKYKQQITTSNKSTLLKKNNDDYNENLSNKLNKGELMSNLDTNNKGINNLNKK